MSERPTTPPATEPKPAPAPAAAPAAAPTTTTEAPRDMLAVLLPKSRAALVQAWGAPASPPLAFFFFYGHTVPAPGAVTKACFSQWYPHAPFVVEGVTYATAEHWMMAEKARLFKDAEAERAILRPGVDAKEAKRLGRGVRGFEEEAWSARCFDVVVRGNMAKFAQHDALRDFLLGTGHTVIVEASPTDTVWGIGLSADSAAARDPRTWRGSNLLGFALMEVRDHFRASLRKE